MKSAAFFLIPLCFAVSPTLAADASPAKAERPDANLRIPETLMFTIDELNEIQSRASSGDAGAAGKASAIEDAALYLSTIVFYGPDDWTIWVNGKPIGPKQEFNGFKILDINARYVELLVPLSAQGMRPVRLSPNQSFVAKSGVIVEGPWQQ